jgi:23S rRNA (cytidine1920-2'-O)/16S rRNA (cytidine1409-2'-O)-methyltransferase
LWAKSLKVRADVFLVEQGYAKSRSEAQAAIAAGSVTADGKTIMRAAQPLSQGMRIAYAPAHPYVSRGALKLIAALDHFRLSPQGQVALDLGASTGGFTQLLLERGAFKVHALDVGHGQMNAALAGDPRIVLHEGLNARDLTAARLGEPISAVTADLSFISLKLALAPALALGEKGAWLVALVKPQFEAGRGNIGKGGIVRDAHVRDAARGAIEIFVAESGWRVLGTIESPIAGRDGNLEYLLAARKS